MTPERYRLVKRLFQQVLEQPLDKRAAYLQQACGDDGELYLEVRNLLKADFTQKQFLETPAVAPMAQVLQSASVDVEDRTPTRIGSYAVHKLIGTGGMGAVYLGSRADQTYTMQVAIKVIRKGMESDKILQRFRRERDIVGSLDHPNIARLLDGGATEDGRPYLVMEYIEGVPLDRWCDSKKLTIHQRLKLFLQVCEAIHYAHQNLIIHRDIKPGNILVRSDGRVKLLDFGIAKILNPEAGGGVADKTATSLRLMTPQYASPEQVHGEQVTTASDVYLLGVVLYELLTGHRPYDVKENDAVQMMQAMGKGEPPKPSDALFRTVEDWNTNGTHQEIKGPLTVCATRDGNPALVVKQLRGDVDAIALKALKRDPKQRYQSASQLAQDIRNHLSLQPVSAREDNAAYRIGLMMRRNFAATAAAAGLLFLLLFITIVAVWQASRARTERVRAESRFAEARKMANSLMYELQDTLAPIPGTTEARKVLIARSTDYVARLAKESGEDVALRRELAAGYLRLGHLLGNPDYLHVGDPIAALESYRQAIGIYERLVESQGESKEDLAQALEAQARVQRSTGDVAGAVASLRKATAHRAANGGIGLAHLALLLAESGNPEEALAVLRQAEQAGPPSPELFRMVAKVRVALNQPSQALQALRQAVALGEQAINRRPELAAALEDQAALEKDPAASGRLITRAMQIRRAMLASDAHILEHRRGNAHSLLRQQRYPEAIEAYQQLLQMDPSSVPIRMDLLETYTQAATWHYGNRNYDVAGKMNAERLRLAREWLVAEPKSALATEALAAAHLRQAEILEAGGNRAAAEAQARTAAELAGSMAKRLPSYVGISKVKAHVHLILARILAESGQCRAADGERRAAQQIYGALGQQNQLTAGDRRLALAPPAPCTASSAGN